MSAKERQYKTNLGDIRADHLARYLWASDMIGPAGKAIDAACGCGYGSSILADRGLDVTALDISPEALAYGMRHWDRPSIAWGQCDLLCSPVLPNADVVVSFETVEHLKRPKKFLRAAREAAPRLILSVPNEEVIPFHASRFPFHCRHYTRRQLFKRLRECGWGVRAWFGQKDKHSLVVPELDGRTLIVDAIRV